MTERGIKDEESEAPGRHHGRAEVLSTTMTMTALCMATFLAALDMTIITTALPTIASYFESNPLDYLWIGSSYLLGAATLTPIWGKLSDIFGRKPMLLITSVVFFAGSLLCALSPSIAALLVGRAIQGIGGGGLTVMTQICIGHLFSPRSRAMFYGILSMIWAFACAVGPVLGGVFTQRVSWRWCFYINLPCDGLAFVLIMLFIKIESPKTSFLTGLLECDWLGSLAIIGGTTMLLLGLNFGNTTFPWQSPTTICLIIFGLVLFVSFSVIEAYIPRYPIMPLRLFRLLSNVACILTCLLQSLVFISATYFLPLYFQDVLLVSPLLSGIYLLPFVVSLALSAAASGVIIRKVGIYRPLIWLGMAMLALGFGLFVDFPSSASWPRIIIYQIVAGIGTGPNFQAPLVALQNQVSPKDMATATGAFLFIRNLATAMSVVFGGAIFDNQLARLVSANRSLPDSVRQVTRSSLTSINSKFVAGLPESQKRHLLQAYTVALRDIWIFHTCCAAIGLGIALLIKHKELGEDQQALGQSSETQSMHPDQAEKKLSAL